jgi:hypothetical protein
MLFRDDAMLVHIGNSALALVLRCGDSHSPLNQRWSRDRALKAVTMIWGVEKV